MHNHTYHLLRFLPQSLLLLVMILGMSIHSVSAKKKASDNHDVFNYLLNQSEKYMTLRQLSLQRALHGGPDSIHAYQQNKSNAILDMFGELNSISRETKQVTSRNISLQRYDDFWLSRYLIDDRIPADLYLPAQTSDSLFPAVLFLCGHEITGFETESYVKTAEDLARNGIATLVVEPVSASRRTQLTQPDGNPLTKRTTSEHTLLNNSGLLIGQPIPKEMLRDNIIAFHFLASLDIIDTARIGLIGNSGGGAQTSFLSAVIGSRVKAVACCSWFTQRQKMLSKYGPDDACQYWPGELVRQIDIPDYYLIQAPKPVLILAGTKDFMDYDGTRNGFEEIKQTWNLLGSHDCELFTVNDGHGIGPEKREAAVLFFRKYLNVSSPYVSERRSSPKDDILTFEEANTYKKNEVDRLSSLASLYKARHHTFTEMSLPSRQKIIIETTGVSYPTVTKVTKDNKRKDLPSYSLNRNDDRPSLPFYIKENETGTGIAILLNAKGKETTLSSLPSFSNGMHLLIIPDLTGVGTLADDSTKNNPKFMNSDYRTAALSIMLGSSVVTMQTEDIIDLALWAADKWKDEDITIFSDASLSIPARHANFLLQNQKGISSVHIHESSPQMDWQDIINSPARPNLLRSVVPNAWKYYELDNLQ